jgi:hypothetical protein
MLVSKARWVLVLLFFRGLYLNSSLWQISASAAAEFKLV